MIGPEATPLVAMEIKIHSGTLARQIIAMAQAMDISPIDFATNLLINAVKGQDQTEDEWLWASKPDDLGTGIFLVPDVEQNEQGGATKKVLVPNITYLDCVRRGRNCVYKWVPHSIAPYESLLIPVCGGDMKS